MRHGLALAWAAGCLWLWHARGFDPQPELLVSFLALLAHLGSAPLLSHLLSLGAASLVMLAAYGAGRGALRALGYSRADTPLLPYAALAFGACLLSLLLLALGAAHGWSKALLLAFTAAPAALGLPLAREDFLAARAAPAGPASSRGERALAWVFGALAALFAGLNLLSALGPEFFYDSLTYHLALPHLYLLRGALTATPWSVYSGVPLGAEMLSGPALAWGGASAAQALHCGFALACSALAYSWLRPRRGAAAAALGALLPPALPLLSFMSWTAKSDLLWIYCGFTAALILAEALRHEEEAPRRRLLALAGLCLGAAAGAKYNALPGFAAFAAPVALCSWRAGRDRRSLLRDAAALLGPALLLFLPWCLKNVVWFANPLYPFLQGVFSGSGGGAAWSAARGGPVGAARLLDFFTAPWSAEWTAENYLGPVALAMLPWLLSARRDEGRRALLLTLAGLWLVWAASTRMPRFLGPALPLVVTLAVDGLFDGRRPLWARNAGAGLAVVAALVGFRVALALWGDQGTWKVSVFGEDRRAFLEAEHPGYNAPYYVAAPFLDTLPADAVVLFVAEERGFHCPRPFIAPSTYDRDLFVEAANAAESPRDFAARLRALGATHVLLNARLAPVGEALERLTPRAQALVASAQAMTLVFEQRRPQAWVRVYAVAKPGA